MGGLWVFLFGWFGLLFCLFVFVFFYSELHLYSFFCVWKCEVCIVWFCTLALSALKIWAVQFAEVFFIYKVCTLNSGGGNLTLSTTSGMSFYRDFVLKALYKLYVQYFSAMKAPPRRKQSFYSLREFCGKIWRQKVSTRAGTSLGYC